MTENMTAQPALDPAQHEQELIAQVIEGAFQAEDSLSEIDAAIEQTTAAFGNLGYERLRGVLGALRKFFEGVLLLRSANHSEALPLFEESANEFDQHGQIELKELSLGFWCSSGAYLELQKGNVSQALEALNQAKMHMKGVGQFGSMGDLMTRMMERDVLAISAMRAMSSLDYSGAKIFYEQAAQTSESIAAKFDDPSTLFNFHQGLAYFYRAFSTFNQTYNRFNQLRYDEIARQANISGDATRAKDLLSNSDKDDKSAERLTYISEGLCNLLEVIQSLSQFMEKVLRSTVKPDAEAFQRSRDKIEAASNLFTKAGPDAVSIVRFCEELTARLTKIEELTRPSKKDFGKFSGIIACASFLPLFLVTSWANSAFKVGLSASTLMWYCLALALVSGFGFGALKFRTLFLGAGTSGSPAA